MAEVDPRSASLQSPVERLRSPEGRRRAQRYIQAAIQILVDTYVREEGIEHTMVLKIYVRGGKLVDWTEEVHRKPLD